MSSGTDVNDASMNTLCNFLGSLYYHESVPAVNHCGKLSACYIWVWHILYVPVRDTRREAKRGEFVSTSACVENKNVLNSEFTNIS